MAEIQITEDWKLTSDSYGWHIHERAIIKIGKMAGQETWKTKFHYPKLHMAIQGLAEHMLRDSDATNLMELEASAVRIRDTLRDICKNSGVGDE